MLSASLSHRKMLPQSEPETINSLFPPKKLTPLTLETDIEKFDETLLPTQVHSKHFLQLNELECIVLPVALFLCP